jgi:hypothetical protein
LSAALRAEAHGLKPIVLIGEAGLTANVLKEISLGLDSRPDQSPRVRRRPRSPHRDVRNHLRAAESGAGAAHRQAAGAVPPESGNRKSRSASAGKGMREVTIVKASPTGTKRPSVTKVLLKGNERVTQGGNIKRAKTRQKSTKKTVLG